MYIYLLMAIKGFMLNPYGWEGPLGLWNQLGPFSILFRYRARKEAHRHNPTRCVGPIAQFPYQVGSTYCPSAWGAWVKLMEPGKRTYRLPAWEFVRFLMRAARAPAAGISRSPGGTWSHANLIITWTSHPRSSFHHSRPSASLAFSSPGDNIHLVQLSFIVL